MKNYIAKIVAFVLLTFSSLPSYAQDGGGLIDIDIDTNQAWYESPWALVGLVAVLIVVALVVRRK